MTTRAHSHGAASAASASRQRLLIVLALVVGFLVVEVVGSMLTNSLALLADAGHMLTDAVGIGLAAVVVAGIVILTTGWTAACEPRASPTRTTCTRGL